MDRAPDTDRASRRWARWLRRRLFWRVYLHGVVLVVLVVIAVGVLAISGGTAPPWKRLNAALAQDIAGQAARRSPAELSHELTRLQRQLGVRITVYDGNNRVLASAKGAPVPPIEAGELGRLGERPRWYRHGRMVAAVRSGDRRSGYVVVAAPRHDAQHMLVVLLVVLLVLALGSIPLARGIVSPLEQLTITARRLGAGELSARTGLHRIDEVGQLARAFDEMAGRIERLLRGEKELLANISHELRTPLARIRVALDLAAEGDAEEARRYITEIESDLEELDALIEDVLTASRLDLAAGGGQTPLRREAVQAAELVTQAAERFRRAHPQRTLELSLTEPLPALSADRVLLRRVVDNLLQNAHKYSAAAEPITLTARTAEEALEISVADRGIGVAPKDLPRLFDPFFRADRSRARDSGGVGLGLALARRIVEAHGGEIEALSEAGAGTTVRFRVPAAPASDPGAPAGAA